MPARFSVSLSWFKRPGTGSAFIPREGTVHVWVTPDPVTNKQISVNIDITIRLSTSSNRNSLFFNSFAGTINESYEIFGKFLYS